MAPLLIYSSRASGSGRAVILTAKNLKIEFTVKELDYFAREHKQEWYKKIHPQGLLPALDDNGFILLESRAISQYLVNSRGNGSSLYPTDAKKRAIVDERMYFDACTFFSKIEDLWVHGMNGGVDVTEKNRNDLFDVFSHLNSFLTGNKWLAGNELTIADFHCLSLVAELYHFEFPIENYPEVKRWWEQSKTAVIGFDENLIEAKEGMDVLGKKMTGKKFK